MHIERDTLLFLLAYPPVDGAREKHDKWKTLILGHQHAAFPDEFVEELNKPGFVSVTCYNMARSFAEIL
jgi:hypothetical protein